MADLSQLSDQDLLALHQQMANQTVNQLESNGAPDSATGIVSKAGAQGNMQVMPATQGRPGFGVRPSDGSPEDTAREGRDYLAALQKHYGEEAGTAAYNWGPGNLEKANGDISKLPDETLKYLYHYNQKMGIAGDQSTKKVDSPLSQLSDDQLKKLYEAQTQKPKVSDNAKRIQDFENQAKQNLDASVNATQGVGEAVANMASGGASMALGGLRSLADLATGRSDQATADIARTENELTYQPRTPEGKQYAQKLSEGFGKVQGAMEQGAVNAMGAIPFIGEDLAKNQTAQEVAKTGADIVANVGPMLLGMEGAKPGEARGPVVKDLGAASELDKLNKLYENEPMPNTPENMPTNQAELDPEVFQEAFRNSEAVRAQNIGNQEVDLQPTVEDTLQRLREQAQGEQEGIVRDAQMASERETGQGNLFSDSMAGRVADFNDRVQQGHEFTQGDLFNELDQRRFDQHGPDEEPRTLSKDEFQQTVQNLAGQEGTRFEMPENIDQAYSKYLDTVSDKQGGLFDRPTIAENFKDQLRDQILSDRVASHPVIKKLQSQVDMLQQAVMSDPNFKQANLDEAKARLEKAKNNIAKTLGYDKVGEIQAGKDGVVYMHAGIHLPTMFKHLAAILKNLHGIVFRTLDKLPRKFGNLDSTGKIFAQGIRDKIAEQANKKWDTQVNEKPKEVLKGVPGLREGLKDYLPFEARDDLTPADLKSQMQQASDLSSGKLTGFLRDNFLTGQQLQAFTHHPLIKYATETIDRAFRDSQKYVRDNLTGRDGLRNNVRKLSDDEFSSIWHLMQENEGIREFNGDQLKNAGFNDKQIKVYQQLRKLDKDNLDALNKGRAQAGLKPIDARVAHIAGHFLGDFKRLITDSEGKVVAVIAHNLRPAVETITKRVMEQLGEGYEAGPIQMRKLSEGNQADRYTGYMNILNDMAGRDDVVAKVVDAYRDYMVNDGQTAMKYRAAFKSKEGVIGAEGRKSWLSSIQNAKDGMKNFLKAQEAMHTWSNTQEALSKISQFTTDPEIEAPNAKQAVQHYLDIVQRRNQGPAADFTNAMINAVADVSGVGPSILRSTSSAIKTNLLTMFIGLGKLSHSFVTLIQPLQGIPVVNSLMKAEGSKLGLTQLTAIAKSFGSQVKLSKALAGGELTGFEKRAMDFARANDTLNTTQFQFGNLTDINRSRLGANLHKMAEFNVTGMETATRSFTYMYYAHMLRDLGLSEKEIFPAAHNAMRDVMVDYNSWERPGIFGKLGFLGDLTAMLTRYKFNQIDQFARASRFAANGHIGPMATVMTTAMLAAGVRGVMAYALANALVSHVTTWAAENNLMQKPTSLDEILLHALHGTNQSLSDVVKFGLPAGLGLNMTGSLSHADDIPNDPLGALVPQSEPMANYAKGIYGFLHDPNAATAKNALYQLSPNSFRGMEENAMFTDKNGNYFDPQTGELRTRRTPSAQVVRNGGFRPLQEARESLTNQVNKEAESNQAAVRADILNRVVQDVNSNNKKVTPDLVNEIRSKYVQKYLANGGDPNEITSTIEKHLGMGQARTAAEREQGIPNGTLANILKYQRYENLK